MQLQDKNFFQIFSQPENYFLDQEVLADNYRSLQAQVHPDKFAGASEPEKMRAVQAASLLNEAFETLSSPQKRAAYLLRLQGIDVEEVVQADLSPALLMEQIELREELEAIPRMESSLESLDDMRRRIEGRIGQSQQSFSDQFGQGQLDKAKLSYFEMQYFFKLLIEVEAVEEDLMGY